MASVDGRVSASCVHLLTSEFVTCLKAQCEDNRAGREVMYKKLEGMGFHVGRRLVERLTRDRERLSERLEVVKFLCRVFWKETFQKGVDKLQTNHKGVFVLQDNDFQPLRCMSSPAGSDTKQDSLKYLVYPCGAIRGALAGLGLDCIVNADIVSGTCCTFNIRVKG